MTVFSSVSFFDRSGYLFGSRALTHGLFWVGYYIAFSFIWMRAETGLFASFYLEFVLLPARILCVYCVIYVLLPRYLLVKRFRLFLLTYVAILTIAASLQSLVTVYFYYGLLFPEHESSMSFSQWLKNLMLINSTVIFLSALAILKRYFALSDNQQKLTDEKIEILAERRTHIVALSDITYIQGMGNYVEIHFNSRKKLTTYSSIKAMQEKLSNDFVRVHKSYIVNKHYIESFNANDMQVQGISIPRGREYEGANLASLNG